MVSIFTPRELNVARQCLIEKASKWKSYYIYRVYNFDPKNKTANINESSIILMIADIQHWHRPAWKDTTYR